MAQNEISVIESDDYREEELALMADPIIRQMAAELPIGFDTGTYNFMRATSNEYRRRGGTNARSLGGPMRAIAKIKKSERQRNAWRGSNA